MCTSVVTLVPALLDVVLPNFYLGLGRGTFLADGVAHFYRDVKECASVRMLDEKVFL